MRSDSLKRNHHCPLLLAKSRCAREIAADLEPRADVFELHPVDTNYINHLVLGDRSPKGNVRPSNCLFKCVLAKGAEGRGHVRLYCGGTLE